MDLVKERRANVRCILEETIVKIREAIVNQDRAEVFRQQGSLHSTYTRLERWNEDIINGYVALTDENSAVERREEIRAAECDRLNYVEVEKDVQFFEAAQAAAIPSSNTQVREKRNIKLPKIQLPKFDGQVKNWLGFWSQFTKIDEDQSLSIIDKFIYLRDSMVSESPAAELVNSYVPSERSYPIVVQQLKERFARDGLLIETYMRELLALVMRNQNGQNTELRILFDRLETQLRALESLGLASNKYAAMLKPLVESALPEDILRAWERSRIHLRVTENREGEELDALLRFLRSEVHGEQRIQLAKSTFGKSTGNSPHTTTNLFSCAGSSEAKMRQRNTNIRKNQVNTNCVWCDGAGPGHTSSECCKARTWCFEERMGYLKKKRACFVCLKVGTGHRGSDCRAFVKCMICTRRHYTILCRQFSGAGMHAQQKVTVGLTTSEDPKQSKEGAAKAKFSHEAGPTLLQTLRDQRKLETLRGEQDVEESRRQDSTTLCNIHINGEERDEIALPWKGRTPRLSSQSTDSSKAFLQKAIILRDRKYSKFLWWENGRNSIQYRHRRVVLASSPSLLNATGEHHLEKAPDEFKKGKQKLKSTLYMDNGTQFPEGRTRGDWDTKQTPGSQEAGIFLGGNVKNLLQF